MTSAVPAEAIPLNRLSKELIEAIDIVSDPLSQNRDPAGYSTSLKDLVILISDAETWERIWEVKEGSKTNKVLNQLGEKRVNWLKRFHGWVVE